MFPLSFILFFAKHSSSFKILFSDPSLMKLSLIDPGSLSCPFFCVSIPASCIMIIYGSLILILTLNPQQQILFLVIFLFLIYTILQYIYITI